jgi:ribosomal protein S27E
MTVDLVCPDCERDIRVFDAEQKADLLCPTCGATVPIPEQRSPGNRKLPAKAREGMA